jgi:hypothetical protein
VREYKIREGSMYSGIHTIYENESDFRINVSNPDTKLFRWAESDFNNYGIGDYVVAEDGFVVQILGIREMKTKKERKGRTVFIRFPMGTFAVYEKADGTVYYPRFYAQFTTGDKGSASGRSRNNFTGNVDEAKKRFAHLLFKGFDKREAFRIAFAYYKFLTPSQIEGKITKLLKDEMVLTELKRLLEPQKKKLQTMFSDDIMLNHIDQLLSNCRKGTAEHRKNIELVLSLRGII